LKSQIIKLRKKIYKNLKEKASSYESRTREINEYYADQEKFSNRKFKICDINQIKSKVLKSDLFFLGDFHTFDQNIRNVLRILRFIISENKNCILALEMISSDHQLQVDAYMEGHLTDLEFLETIDYHDSWRFPWTHYKLIFELAKKNNIKVIALNTNGSLKERDIHASEIIENISIENQDSKILVLYGELHITINKIPALMKEKCPNLVQTIIHQNLDEVYWKLIKQDIEQGVISFSENEYCIVSAPPWIKYESMIYWYENLCDDPDFDIHEYIIENGKKIFSEDTSENFLLICSDIINHLEFEIDLNIIEDFNLYDHTNLSFVEEKLKLSLRPSLFNFYKYLIETNKSFRFPSNTTFYCSSYSMNRISYLAGIHIFHYFLGAENNVAIETLNSKSNQNKFFLFTFENMFGYFFSKIINPHRKCEMYKDLKRMSTSSKDENSKRILEKSLLLLDRDRFSSILAGMPLKDIYEISLNVGHILGEYLYLNYSKGNKQSFDQTQFFNIKINQKEFCKVRKELLKNQLYQDASKRYF
jgi:hypothetical protein